MDRWDRGLLHAGQSTRVAQWLGEPVVVEDLSWGVVDTTVLRVRSREGEVIVKGAGAENHHIRREITAHESHTGPLVVSGHAARMQHADPALNLLVLDYLDGRLIEGGPDEFSADVHRQAGAILATLHAQTERMDDDYERRATAKALRWLDRPHRIAADAEAEARLILDAYRPKPVRVVPTHGDWHPRNWIIDGTAVKAIDFGRFDLRPPATDLCRLAVQQWRDRPDLAGAFMTGYGDDPRDADVWPMDLLREAIATAAWAYQVGDNAFENRGHVLLSEAIARF